MKCPCLLLSRSQGEFEDENTGKSRAYDSIRAISIDSVPGPTSTGLDVMKLSVPQKLAESLPFTGFPKLAVLDLAVGADSKGKATMKLQGIDGPIRDCKLVESLQQAMAK